ncbi:ATP synthase gamma chain [hydrothermal vent metagenome]|uniref:ATP synthase gamma chain n=1 Tax=hydrothermal vent metagenome TaxID=652676 RepID=A0A3B0Y9Q2_9ZZZZ
MSGAKEIRGKIKSIKNTQKITKAMEMVAASKMRKAQDRMRASRPYAEKMRNVIAHLSQAHAEIKHPYMIKREIKRVGYIVVTSDRGLCGGLNANLFKKTIGDMKAQHDKGVEIDVVPVGRKAVDFFKRQNANIVAQASQLGDTPRMHDLIGSIKIMLDAFTEGKIDALYLVSNTFVNTMTQAPTVLQMLPVSGSSDEKLKHYWDYLYEPDSKAVLDGLLMRFVESQVYQGVVENIACEMSARMVAMKSATDNANDIISELETVYNKARQAAITQEISEIVAGASAV